MFFNFHCRYLMPIPIFLYYSSSIYFASWGKITTPGAILPSAKHFQTATERYFSAYFSSGFIKKIISQVTIILWGKIYTLVLPCEANYTLLELFCHQPNMIGWTGHMTSLDSLTVSVDCDICKWVSLIGQVMLCFQCWQVVSSFFLALCEL